MDLIKLAEDLGLEETKEYKYRIRPIENCRGYYYIERLNKENGFLCSIRVSDTMILHSLREGLIKEFASLLHNNFNSAENKALIQRAEYHEGLPPYNYSETKDKVKPI